MFNCYNDYILSKKVIVKKMDNITINNNQYEIEQIVSIKMKEETEGGYIYYGI